MKKRILITMFDMEIGGAERSLINMLDAFDYERHEVDLFICKHTGDFLGLIPEQVNVLPQIGAYTVFRKSISQCVREKYFAAAIIRIAAKLLAKFQARRRKLQEGGGYIQMQLAAKYTVKLLPHIAGQYDLAISYAWPHDIVARQVQAHTKLAWIHTDFSQLEINNELDLAVWSQYDLIASISDSCTEAFLSRYPSLTARIISISNITSPAFIRNMANAGNAFVQNEQHDFKIVSVGRLSFVKGFDMAIQALRALHDEGYTNMKWYVVGYGGYEAELQALIDEYELREAFFLLGKKANPYPYMKSCDLYVQPSRYEGKAVTVTEAQILGKPVLITNYPTAASQVTNEQDGVICELSVKGIAQGIKRLYTDIGLRNAVMSNLVRIDFSNVVELQKLYTITECDTAAQTEGALA